LDASAAEIPSTPISEAGIETEPKQEPERIHVPAAGDQPKRPRGAGVRIISQRREKVRSVPLRYSVFASPYNTLEEPVHTPISHEEIDDRDANQENTDTNVPITPPASINPGKRCCRPLAVRASDQRGGKHNGGGAKREKESPTVIGRLPSCINLRVNVVDRGDVIRVDRVPQSEAIGDQSGR